MHEYAGLTQSTMRKEDFLRRFLLNDIKAQTEPTFCNNGIKETFLLIARLIKPIKDPIKRALSSTLTKKVDECPSVQERPIDGTSFRPRNEPLIRVIYSRADFPSLANEPSDQIRHESHTSIRDFQQYDYDDSNRQDDTSSGSDSGPESEPSSVVSPSDRVYIPSPIPPPSRPVYRPDPVYESSALIGERRIIDYDEYCKTLTRLQNEKDLNDYFHSDVESVELSDDEQEVMNKWSKNICDDDENNPETPQERNQRYRNMLIETMSKYTKRKYDTVNSARKESVDQTQQDTSINSDE